MRTDLLLVHVIYFVGAICFVVAPLQRSRVRSSWSRWAFFIVAAMLTGMGVLGLADDLGVQLIETTRIRLVGLLSFTRGMVLGLLLALILSGQLAGKKAVTNEPAA